MDKRKQISFDIDTNVAKKIFGEQSYTKIYGDIREFMENEDWKHIEGSVYMSGKPLSNADISYMIQDIKRHYPYLEKCIREIHQADVSNVHSLNQYFAYDGTPGQYERPPGKTAEGHERETRGKPSVRKRLEKNKAVVNEKNLSSEERAGPHHNRDDLLR